MQTPDAATTPPATEIALADYAKVDEVSLTLHPGVTLEDIGSLKGILGRRSAAYRWYLGDLLYQAEGIFGETYSQLLEEHEYETLHGYQWLAGKIPPELRDPSVPHTYYRDIATLSLAAIADLIHRFLEESPSRDVWKSWVAEAKGETPKEKPQRDLSGAVSYLRNKEGQVWTEDDTVAVRAYIKA